MNDTGDIHTARAQVFAGADLVFAYLIDPAKIGGWNLGAMRTKRLASGAVQGTSLFDGGATVFKLEPDATARTVDYRVGRGPENLRLRISARVESGATDGCVIVLRAERPPSMDDERWRRLRLTHEVEVLLIKAQAETEAENEAQSPSN